MSARVASMAVAATLLTSGTIGAQGTAAAGSSWTEWLLPLGEYSVGQPQAAMCRLYIREVGEGPMVVFLHGGWGGEHGYLVDAFLPLSDGFRLVFYDQRGSVRSRCDQGPTAADHVADLDILREAPGEERLLLVAHSMGGWLAMAYAAQHPDRVAGLALLSPTPARSVDNVMLSQDELMARWTRPAVIEEIEKHGLTLDRMPDQTPQQWSMNHRIIFGATNLHDVTRWRELPPPWLHSEEAGNSAAASMPETWDFTGALAALQIPVLIVVGESDYVSVEGQRRWTAMVPKAGLAVVEAAGHASWVDQPQIVEDVVRPYLDARAAGTDDTKKDRERGGEQ